MGAGIPVTGGHRRGDSSSPRNRHLPVGRAHRRCTSLLIRRQTIARCASSDGSADRQGRFWAGSTQADDQSANLPPLLRRRRPLRPHHGGRPARLMASAGAPTTGPCTSLREFAYELIAFDYDPAYRRHREPAGLATVPEEDGLPDGLTVDAEGACGAHTGVAGGSPTPRREDRAGGADSRAQSRVASSGPDLKATCTSPLPGAGSRPNSAAAPCGGLAVVHTEHPGRSLQPMLAKVEVGVGAETVVAVVAPVLASNPHLCTSMPYSRCNRAMSSRSAEGREPLTVRQELRGHGRTPQQSSRPLGDGWHEAEQRADLRRSSAFSVLDFI